MPIESPSDSSARAVGWMRNRASGAPARVTNIELFFDLVFVYAVTQLSHTLQQQPDVVGAFHVLLLFLAVWWVWIFTGWVTNWLDPERPAVRLLMLCLMLAALLLSVALPDAFGSHGLLFAGTYVFMQVGRTLFMLWALRVGTTSQRHNFHRILVWLTFSGVLWLLGAYQRGSTREALWIAALTVEYVAPAVMFYVPGLRRSSIGDWNVDGGHLAERCSSFVIIALGESVVVTGSSFGESGREGPVLLAFIVAFVGAVAMWWIYFDLGAERGSRAIRQAADPGRQARLAYTYLHLLIVAGIIVSAVGDRLSLVHPEMTTDLPSALILLGGVALYLMGNALFKKTVNSTNFPLSHLVGLLLLIPLLMFFKAFSVLALSATTTALLMLIALWESLSLRSVRRELTES